MLNLFLTIGLISGLFLIFKSYPRYHIHTLNAVVINYVTCVVVGTLYTGTSASWQSFDLSTNWVQLSLLIGVLFILGFYLIGLTVSKLGVTAGTISNKMSFIVPVLANLLVMKTSAPLGPVKVLGLIAGITSIALTSSRKEEKDPTTPKSRFYILLPVVVFLLGGITDTLMNYANFRFLPPGKEAVFSIYCFLSAAVTGLVIMLIQSFRGVRPRLKDVVGGIALGLPNYFSIYFLLKTLTDYHHDGSLVFPVLNISVIVLTTVFAVTVFKEKLSLSNIVGIFLAILSIILVFLEVS